jgi:hypothetical protein
MEITTTEQPHPLRNEEWVARTLSAIRMVSLSKRHAALAQCMVPVATTERGTLPVGTFPTVVNVPVVALMV